MGAEDLQPRICPVGDSALLVEFGRQIDEAANERVQALAAALGLPAPNWLVDTIPAFASLLICYDALAVDYEGAAAYVAKLAAGAVAVGEAKKRRIWELPVCYEPEFGPDMPDMEQICGLSRQEIIAIHSGRDYKIFMLGFLPGFAYLGGLDPRIAAPRLASPRQSIEAGSVGIGGEQTGIYPYVSPGGWRLLGKTPLTLYDPRRTEPIFYQAGDYIRFCPIDREEYEQLRQRVDAGAWQPREILRLEAGKGGGC